MGRAIAVRADYTSGEVRRVAQRVKNAAQARRLLAIAAVLDGASREDAAKIGGMDRQTLRDWVIRFNEQGPAGLRSDHVAVRGIWHLGLRRYRLPCLEGLGLLPCERQAQGLQAEHRRHGGVQKNFPARVAEIRQKLAPGTPIEVWCQDEMRVGQKNKLTYRWARKGSRPRAAHDQRTQSTYLFGAVCPERGAGAALVLPACNSEAMQLHLDEIATKVTPGAHAILLLDRAGWHRAKALTA